jgi:hypothetical protein
MKNKMEVFSSIFCGFEAAMLIEFGEILTGQGVVARVKSLGRFRWRDEIL